MSKLEELRNRFESLKTESFGEDVLKSAAGSEAVTIANKIKRDFGFDIWRTDELKDRVTGDYSLTFKQRRTSDAVGFTQLDQSDVNEMKNRLSSVLNIVDTTFFDGDNEVSFYFTV